MPSAKRDYYEVLIVSKAATDDEIKRSYRKLAMKFHPDRNPGDAAAEASFRECAEAYEVLSDDTKRSRYDQYGHAGVQGVHDYSHMNTGDISSMFADIFESLGIGGGRRGGRQQSARGFDLETQVELTLAEVASGVERTIDFERAETCETCKGTGAKAGSAPIICPQCGGQGRVAQAGFGGMFRMVTTCPTCQGRGATVKDKCGKCQGAGKVAKKRAVTVKIPAGVHEGQAVRIAGEGEPGESGAPAGDLHVYISVKPHSVFTRHGADVVCQVPVGFAIATLGGEIDVPTLKGVERLTINAGTQHGELFKLKGKGLPELRGYKSGDQVVQVLIEIPRKLTDRQKQLLQEFADTEDGSGLPQRRSFLEKLKGLLD